MSILIAMYFLLLLAASGYLLLIPRPRYLRKMLWAYLALAAACALAFFLVAARIAVPFPDSGPIPTGHILEGVVAMFRVSQFFVGSLAIVAITTSVVALRLSSPQADAA